MPEYTHTLIPARATYVPNPAQVGEFVVALTALGAAPIKPTISVAILSGQVRQYKNPFTGQMTSQATRKAKKVKDIAALPSALEGLDDYDVALAGKGPPRLPAMVFDSNDEYEFSVNLCLREHVISTSDWHDEVPIDRKVEMFGTPCDARNRLGIFHYPSTLEVIKVPNAGCARFWIEFEYGQALFPTIDDHLDLIEPKIIAAAEKALGVKFSQGCRWCA
jgi:hypothetical protein